jgi:carboxypeptidase Q
LGLGCVDRATADESTTLASQYSEASQQLIGAALTSDEAWTRLSELCDGIGHRVSGSASLEKAVQWAAERMRQDGLDVRLQAAMVPHWVRGEESIEMLEPRQEPLAMLGLGRSVGTPKQGITADVVVVSSFAELDALPDAAVRGKIVLYNVPFTTYGETVKYRSAGCDSASRRGAVAALVRSVGPVSLQTPHTGSLSYKDSTVAQIPGAALTIEGSEMIARLAGRGVPVRLRLQMQAHTEKDLKLSHNVIGELRGSEKPEEIVVMGGHLDSWDVGQGAHDDGGGCVISMEALRLIKELGLRPRRTLRVVLWTNEESGLAGATAYRDSLGDTVGKHVAAIESDGGVERIRGFGVSSVLEDGKTIDEPRQARAQQRMRQIAPLLEGLGADEVLSRGGGADIGPLMKAGVPGISHNTVMEMYFHVHHTDADAMDKVDPTELRKNVAAMAVLSYVLADMPERLDDPLPTP